MQLSILALTCLLSAALGAPVGNERTLSSGKYIIKLKDSVPQRQFRVLLQEHNQKTEGLRNDDAVNTIKHTYDPTFLNAIAGTFTSEFLSELKVKYGNQIDYIERDGEARTMDDGPGILGTQANAPSWGLPRISERKLSGSKNYNYPDQAGSGVQVWIVDTGIQPNHTAFEHRAKMAQSFVQGEEAVDMNGHGTHVAGTIASGLYGVAKKAEIFGVKVLNRNGSGSWSDVVAGIQYVAKNAAKNKSVLNMSLGGGKAQAVDDAVKAAKAAGVAVVVAAGNNNGDACLLSPAGAPDAFAVGAVDNTDTKASFSNWGKCVKINAPGVGITSSWIGADAKATNTISGTSMASPHVAGVAALYLSMFKYASVDALFTDLQTFSTNNLLKGLGNGTPNKLVYNYRLRELVIIPPIKIPPVKPGNSEESD
jgi:subtilisin family serine protease